MAVRMWAAAEKMKLHIAMTVFQLGYAGNHVILRAALNLGISKLVFPLYRNLVALLLLAPFAYFLEKKDRPPLTFGILMQFFLLGFVGIGSNQLFYLLGLDNTSPTLASATENAVPAVTFILATLLRLEQIHFNRRDGIAKVVGTLTSFIGTSVITLYKGPTIYNQLSVSSSSSNQPNIMVVSSNPSPKNWTLGCIFNLGHCFCWSSWIVLQAMILKKYPAPFSVYSFTCFFGILQFFVVGFFFERDLQAWQVHSTDELLSILYSVFVSGYLPLQTILVAVMASIVLGEEFHLGGMIGAILIIAGLYMVLWGKSDETKVATDVEEENKWPLILPLTSD
ncbi:Protein WALLS ARE THIN 1 [Linum grandiflorum]